MIASSATSCKKKTKNKKPYDTNLTINIKCFYQHNLASNLVSKTSHGAPQNNKGSIKKLQNQWFLVFTFRNLNQNSYRRICFDHIAIIFWCIQWNGVWDCMNIINHSTWIWLISVNFGGFILHPIYLTESCNWNLYIYSNIFAFD